MKKITSVLVANRGEIAIPISCLSRNGNPNNCGLQ